MNPGQELGGPNATGRPGDWVLQNREVVLVFDQLGSSAGFAESGGNLIDAADAKDRKDELGQVFTYFGTFPRQAVYELVASHVEDDGLSVLVCSSDVGDLKALCTRVIVLRDGVVADELRGDRVNEVELLSAMEG